MKDSFGVLPATMQLTVDKQQGVISCYHVSVVAIDVMHQVTDLPVPICS